MMMTRRATRGFIQQQQRRRVHSNFPASSPASNNNNNNSHATKTRPLVVLCGWLGCQLPQLRKYEELWQQQFGFDTYSLVASPAAVVDACLNMQEKDRDEDMSRLEDLAPSNHLPPFDSKITDWGLHVSNVLQEKNPEFFMLHVFSNGGCFVYESLSRLWETQVENTQFGQQSTLCKGVVMDSCPAWFGTHPEGLWLVLQTCPKEEMEEVVRIYGEDALRKLDITKGLQRNEEYFAHLAESQPHLPQLYLYSDDDPFADATHIHGLIQKRRQRSTGVPVVEKCWTKSTHCAHLREHPEEYHQSIQEFINGVMKNEVPPALPSKL